MISVLRRLARYLDGDLRREFGQDLDAALAETWRRETSGRPWSRKAGVCAAMVLDLIRQIFLSRWPDRRDHAPLLPPRKTQPMDNLLADIRYAFRTLLRAPVASAVVLLTLTLGIGGATTVFTLINAELIAPLPYRDADRLMSVYATDATGSSVRNLSALNVESLRQMARSLESISGYDDRKPFNLVGGDRPTRVFGASVDGSFFETLGVEPLHGRLLGPQDDRAESPLVVVLAEELWRGHFGADPDIVGSEINLNEQPYTVAGVAPAELRIPDREQLWVPLASYPYGDDRLNQRGSTILEVVARLAPGATHASAAQELGDLASALAADFPDANEELRLESRSLRSELTGHNRTLFALLFGTVTAVLLIACVNVAALLVSRASERRDEIGLRVALGAGRRRIAGQLLTESLVTTVLACAGGLCVAVWSRRAILTAMPGWFPRLEHVGIDSRVLAFAALTATVAGIAFGLLPLLLVADRRPGADDGLTKMRASRTRRALVVVELAGALTLLVVAGLMVQSLVNLARTDNGFLTEEVLTATISLPETRYDEAGRVEFVSRLTDRLGRVPAIVAATGANRLPVSGGTNLIEFSIPDRGPDHEASAHLRLVTADYFETLDVALVEGRLFTAAELEQRELVAVIDVELAERHWPNEAVVGSVIRPAGVPADVRVIGVVERTRHWGPEYGPEPVLYAPYSVAPTSTVMLAARTENNPLAVASVVREAVREIDPELPIEQLQTLADAVSAQTARPRVGGAILAIFSVYALGLAVLGVYGVLGHTVSQRTREMGIRMALGAPRRGIRVLVLREGGRVIALGIAIGLAAGAAAARAIASQLHGLPGMNPVTFIAAATILTIAGFLAAYVPARRATRIDPAECLRSE